MEFADTDAFRANFDKLIGLDVFEGKLDCHFSSGFYSCGIVFASSADVCKLL